MFANHTPTNVQIFGGPLQNLARERYLDPNTSLEPNSVARRKQFGLNFERLCAMIWEDLL